MIRPTVSYQIVCDLCQTPGPESGTVAQARKLAAGRGWRRVVDVEGVAILYEPIGADSILDSQDLCPACYRERYETRALEPDD